MRALIVDDSAPVRSRIADMLREIEGVDQVDEAGSAREALAVIDASRPELIVLDLHMPGESGLIVLSRVKGAQGQQPLVIVVTNDASDRRRQDCIRLGADHFLDKSADFDELCAIVASAARAPGQPSLA